MNKSLSLHIQLEIEVELRKCHLGQVDPLWSMARLIQRYPALGQNTKLGREHPLAEFVMLKEGLQ